MSREQNTLNIFGLPINIQPDGYIVTVRKHDEEVATLTSTNQYGQITQKAIFTVRDFGKTADEFINEFNIQNYHATKHNYPMMFNTNADNDGKTNADNDGKTNADKDGN